MKKDELVSMLDEVADVLEDESLSDSEKLDEIDGIIYENGEGEEE